jgi:hypothetical protein
LVQQAVLQPPLLQQHRPSHLAPHLRRQQRPVAVLLRRRPAALRRHRQPSALVRVHLRRLRRPPRRPLAALRHPVGVMHSSRHAGCSCLLMPALPARRCRVPPCQLSACHFCCPQTSCSAKGGHHWSPAGQPGGSLPGGRRGCQGGRGSRQRAGQSCGTSRNKLWPASQQRRCPCLVHLWCG